MQRLLLIDADSETASLVRGGFDPADVEVVHARTMEEALEEFGQAPTEVVLVMTGEPSVAAESLSRIGRPDSTLPLVILAGSSAGEPWPSETRARIFGWVTGPPEPLELRRVLGIALKAAGDSRPPQITDASQRTLKAEAGMVIGPSLATRAMLAAAEKAVHSEAGVLLIGERGVGKDLLARWIHHHGKRSSGLFITIDCQDRPELLERDLLGEPGRPPIWRADQTSGGTLFLKHIDSMPLSVQAKLETTLRLASLGDSVTSANPRIIASASESLEAAVAARTFREDLLNLVATARIQLPPLRNRLGDLPQLVSYCLARSAIPAGQRPKALSPIVSHIFQVYGWPGNVQELEAILGRSHSFATGDLIELGDLPAAFLSAVGPSLLQAVSGGADWAGTEPVGPVDIDSVARALFQWARADAQFRILPAMERELVLRAMTETGGNQVRVAKLLGITRATLRKRLRRFNIQRSMTYSVSALPAPPTGAQRRMARVRAT